VPTARREPALPSSQGVASAPVWARVPSTVGAELSDVVGLATAVSGREEDVLPPADWAGWSGADSAVVGLPDDFSEELGVEVVVVVLVLVTVTETGLPGFAVNLLASLERPYPVGALVCLAQKSVPVELLTGSWAEAVPLESVVRVRTVVSPVPMLTVAPGSSLPLLLSFAFSSTVAALKGSMIVSGASAPGVTMTSWSSATSWSELPSLSS
jgi:hypothetical protein